MLEYLFSSAFTLGGSFNNTRKIKKLDVGSFVLNHSRNTCQSGKLIGCSFTLSLCQC